MLRCRHPLFNSIAFVLALGEAVLVYRTLPVDHPTQKVTHGVLQAIVFAFGVAAVVCVNRWKTHNGFDHWYSVHSWIGLVLLSLVGLQVFGHRLPMRSGKCTGNALAVH